MLSKLKIFQSFYYGWFILIIAGFGVFFSGPGQTYSNSQFIDEYIHDFGWSRSLVSSVYSIATLLAGFLMIFVGRFIDRFGQRMMMVTIGTLFAWHPCLIASYPVYGCWRLDFFWFVYLVRAACL